MRGNDTVGSVQERIVGQHRLVRHYIQSGPGDLTRAKGLRQIRLVDQTAAGQVKEKRGRLHQGQQAGIHKSTVIRGLGAVQADNVSRCKQLFQGDKTDRTLPVS